MHDIFFLLFLAICGIVTILTFGPAITKTSLRRKIMGGVVVGILALVTIALVAMIFINLFLLRLT